MPYVDIVSEGDRSSLWYTTNTQTGNTGSFDPEKPTILMLPPLFLDTTWLRNQMYDPRLTTHNNIISLDTRSCGKSRSAINGARDSWVDAADVAFFHQALRLPPVHVFAVQMASANIALRFACLFPEMVSSLTLINVPPSIELGWVYHFYDELLPMWCYAEDLNEYEHAAMELSYAMLGFDCEQDLQDELIAAWEMLYPPWRRSSIYEYLGTILNRTALTKEELAAVIAPTFIIQAEKTPVNPVRYARELAKSLINVKGGVKMQVIKGGPEYVSIVPSCASIVNRIFSRFLASLPHTFPPPNVTRVPTAQRMQEALAKLAEFAGDPEIASRNPRSPISFSRVGPDQRQQQQEALNKHKSEQIKAFSPLGHDGRPQRKFSDRYEEHWFGGGRDHVSISTLPEIFKNVKNKEETTMKPVDKALALENRLIEATNAAEKRMQRKRRPTSTVAAAVTQSSRLRRATVDKHQNEKSGAVNFAQTLIQNTIPLSRNFL